MFYFFNWKLYTFLCNEYTVHLDLIEKWQIILFWNFDSFPVSVWFSLTCDLTFPVCSTIHLTIPWLENAFPLFQGFQFFQSEWDTISNDLTFGDSGCFHEFRDTIYRSENWVTLKHNRLFKLEWSQTLSVNKLIGRYSQFLCCRHLSQPVSRYYHWWVFQLWIRVI